MSALAAARLRQPLLAALPREREPDVREVAPLALGQLPPQLELLLHTVHLLAIQLVVDVRIQHGAPFIVYVDPCCRPAPTNTTSGRDTQDHESRSCPGRSGGLLCHAQSNLVAWV